MARRAAFGHGIPEEGTQHSRRRRRDLLSSWGFFSGRGAIPLLFFLFYLPPPLNVRELPKEEGGKRRAPEERDRPKQMV